MKPTTLLLFVLALPGVAHAQGVDVCTRPPAPLQAPRVGAAAAEIGLAQDRIDNERERPRYETTKRSQSDIRRAQTATNQRATSILRSDASQREKDEVIKAVVVRRIRSEGAFSHTEGSELARELEGSQSLLRAQKMNPFRFDMDAENILHPQPLTPRQQLLSDLNRSADDLRHAVIDAALKSADPSARNAAMSLLTGPSFDPSAAFTGMLAQKTGDDAARDGMKRLGELLRARALGQDPRWTSYVDGGDIDRKIETILQDARVVEDMDALRKAFVAEIGRSYEYRAHVDYLRSEEFQTRLTLATDDEAKRIFEREIAKVTVIDPDAARDIVNQVQDRFTLNAIDKLSDEELIRRLAEIEVALGGSGPNMIKTLKIGVDLTKRGARIGAALDAFRTAFRAKALRDASPEAAARSLEAAGFSDTKLGRSIGWMSRLDRQGQASSASAGLGLLLAADDLYNGRLGKGTKADVKALTAVMKAADAHDAFAKLGMWTLGKELARDSVVLTTLRPLKVLGPAADIITGVVDTSRGLSNLHAGNQERGTWQVVGGVGSFVTAGGTILIFAGASGPGAPVVVLVGTLVVIGAGIGEASAYKGAEVEFLRQAQLLSSVPNEVVAWKKVKDEIRNSEAVREQARRNLAAVDHEYGTATQNRSALALRSRLRDDLAASKADLQRLNRDLAKVDEKLALKQMKPTDWDGFWPDDIARREKREQSWNSFRIRQQETIDNMHRMGAPLGR